MLDVLLRFEHPEGLRFEPTDHPNELLAEHTLHDITYRGIFLWFVPLRSYDIYRIRLGVDEPERTVRLQEERETYLKTWTRVRRNVFKGVYVRLRELESAWGRRADGSLGKLYAYTFDSEKMKTPIRELVAANGWKLEERTFG